MKKRKIRRKEKKELPGSKTARALATKLRLRKAKGLRGIPAAALTQDAASSPEEEERLLSEALDAMAPIGPKLRKQLMPRDLDLGPGEYRSASGAVVYPDSVSIKPFVGSEEEENAHLLTKGPLKPKIVEPGSWPKTTCTTCLGWKYINVPTNPCRACESRGWVPSKRA